MMVHRRPGKENNGGKTRAFSRGASAPLIVCRARCKWSAESPAPRRFSIVLPTEYHY